MQIRAKAWSEYIARLSRLNQKAGRLVQAYLDSHGDADGDALIRYAYAVVTRYGEGSAELACQLHDAMAEAERVQVSAAEPAPTASYGEVARLVNATRQSPPQLQSGVSRLVKQAGADTTLHNALRDGAEFAWVPHGDTCPFCIMLASRGWQRASKKALKNGHAEHIHANCDCTYAIRFNSTTSVAGYDPERYLAAYESAEGATPQEKLNAMRRAHYEANQGKITAQKRAAYLERKSTSLAWTGDKTSAILKLKIKPEIGVPELDEYQFQSKESLGRHFPKHAQEFGEITEEEYVLRAASLARRPLSATVEVLMRSDGSISKYDVQTNEFLVLNQDGTIRTYFLPKAKEEYWKNEHERN